MNNDTFSYFSALALAPLRALSIDRPAIPDEQIVPGLYLSWDTQSQGMDVRISATPDLLLSVTATIEQRPQWYSLNFELGTTSFDVGDVLVIVARTEGLEGATLPFFIRSAKADSVNDTTLAEAMSGSAAPKLGTVMHHVEDTEALAHGSAFHTLVLKLPETGGRLTIHDLRLFRVPAAQARALALPSLAEPL